MIPQTHYNDKIITSKTITPAQLVYLLQRTRQMKQATVARIKSEAGIPAAQKLATLSAADASRLIAILKEGF